MVKPSNYHLHITPVIFSYVVLKKNHNFTKCYDQDTAARYGHWFSRTKLQAVAPSTVVILSNGFILKLACNITKTKSQKLAF